MAFPDPKPGLIVRYDYLWSHDAAAGREHGKDRPTCLVAAIDRSGLSRYVVLLPITHAPPDDATVAVEIPAKVKQAIGLDNARSWIVVSEYNIDEWPNAGLTPIPGHPGQFSYGFIPPGLFAQVKAKFLKLAKDKSTKAVQR
ncbi:hypothetical protein [Bradyrhizobium sp. USDA 4353]